MHDLLKKDRIMTRKKIRKGCLKKMVVTLSLVVVCIIAFVKACSCDDGQEGAKKTSENIVKKGEPVDTSLVSKLEKFSQQQRPEGQFAFHVYDITADKDVYGHNDTLALPSASCMKLLSGVAGLKLLGTDFHYWNGIYMRGKVSKDGTLKGDIAFKGSLDPQLMPTDLADFAKSVRRKGVKRVDGKLIVGLYITDPVKSEEHWYPWDLTFSRYGLFYKGEERVIKHLKASLRAQDIQVKDSQIIVTDKIRKKGFQCLHISRRHIDDVVKRMWKNSSNTQATSMLYSIGYTLDPKADPVATGMEYLKTFIRDTLGITSPQIVIHDGCGLCTHNRLSPKSLTTIIRYGYLDSDIRASMNRNLAVSGVDGTLAREMHSPKLRGMIKAKTGTLSHPYGISSLAGICEAPNGHILAFAIMDSEMSVLDARVLQRKLCELLRS